MARGAQQAAYIPSANKASCPAEGTIFRAAGSRRSSLLPYLRCPSGEAAPRCGGKRRRRGKASPRRGRAEAGPSALCCAHPAARPAGRKWEGGYRHLSATRRPGHAGPPSRPGGGAPLRPQGVGVWGWGRGRRAHHAGRGRRAGRGERGFSEPRRASPAPRRTGRQEAPDFRHHPQTSRAVRPPRSSSVRARWSLPGSARGIGAARASGTCADGRCWGWGGLSRQGTGDAARNGTGELRPPPANTWSKERAPQNQEKNLLNQVSHPHPYPGREFSILVMPASRAHC